MKAFKKLLAAGLALALPLSALAQTTPAEPAKPAEQPAPAAPAAEKKPEAPKPAFTLYGTLNVNLQVTRADAPSAPTVTTRPAVSVDSSNIGIRGGYEFTKMFGATFQCETAANVDGISVSGICNRNSRVGLNGPWGTLWYGNWDTPMKAGAYGTKADDPFGNTDVFGFQSIMGSPGFNYRSSAWKTATADSIRGFDIRASNSVGYHSPKWNGLSAKLQYSVDEFADVPGNIRPSLYSGVVNFDSGPISVYGSVERHDDAFGLNFNTPAVAGPPAVAGAAVFGATAGNPTNSSSVDWAYRVGAGYELASPAGTTTVSAAFEQLRYEQENAPTGAIEKFNREAFQVGLKHRTGNHELRGRYSQALEGDCDLRGGAACNTDKYGAKDFAVGYAYHFSKSAQGYAYYTQILNDDNAQYTFSIGGAPAVAGATAKGADPQALGLGLRYAF